MPFPPRLTYSNVFIRRYMLAWEGVDVSDSDGKPMGKVRMIFTPLLKSGLPARSTRARIVFSGKTRAQALHKGIRGWLQGR